MEPVTEGTIHTWTICHFAGEKFAAEVPYTLVMVERDGADTMTLGRLEGAAPEDVRIGMRVKAVSDEKNRYMRFVPL